MLERTPQMDFITHERILNCGFEMLLESRVQNCSSAFWLRSGRK